MNNHFDEIEDSDWMSKQDRNDFAQYCYVYSKHIEPMFGLFDWGNESFVYFCKTNKIQKKGIKATGKKENHFWFNATKPDGASTNDFAHHFLRHIRNAFAHGLIEISYRGRQRHKYYLLKDFERHGEQSMGGYIRSDLLWEMIWILFKTRKQQDGRS